mgnify:CR=1 FL=1
MKNQWFNKRFSELSAAPVFVSRRIEIRCEEKQGKKSVYLCHADRIIKNSDKEIIVRMGKEDTVFTGSGLSLSAYRSGTVEICGHIAALSFTRGKE